jgi:type I restriction enzyme, S subunit
MTTEKKEFLTYPVYKRASVNWIKSLPDHWEVRKAQYLFSRMQRQVQEEDEVITAFRDGRVTLRRFRREEGYTFAIKEIGYQGVRKGDLVISAMDAFAGAIGVSESDGKCSPVYSVCKAAPNVMPHFYGYMLQNMARTGFITSLSKGIRERSTDFRFAEFKVLELPVPPLAEQRDIVTFLDHETAHLDGLIERKNRLLDLLEEQRRAVISQAVTRGLNPDAPLKDSGVSWLGQVPREWEMQRLKNLSVFVTSGSRGWAEYYADDGSIFVRIGNLQRNSINTDLNDIQYVRVPLGAEGERTRIQEGDVLISITADLGSVAAASPVIKDAYVSQHVALVRLNDGVEARWLAYSVMGDLAKSHFKMASYGGTKIQLSLEDVRETPVIVPSLEEQKVIAAYLDLETAKLDVLRQKLEQSIAHLREYRAALITAAVTGQIDVREEATQA